MAAARFTYRLNPGVLGRKDVVEGFLERWGWPSQQSQGGEVVAVHIERWESGEIQWIEFTFRGRTFTVGKLD